MIHGIQILLAWIFIICGFEKKYLFSKLQINRANMVLHWDLEKCPYYGGVHISECPYCRGSTVHGCTIIIDCATGTTHSHSSKASYVIYDHRSICIPIKFSYYTLAMTILWTLPHRFSLLITAHSVQLLRKGEILQISYNTPKCQIYKRWGGG